MKKCLIIPDSFKGTLSATEICEIIKSRVTEIFPKCQTIAIPVADGGEGTVDCFLYALGCDRIELAAQDPYGNGCNAYYAKRDNVAIIEMAMCAGLPQVEGRENPELTSTYGVGQMILHAIEDGCTEILLGLGGSCTNDGGCGMAAALGVRFFNGEGLEFIPTGGTLTKIRQIDLSGISRSLNNCKITAMCDIDNPMHGPSGAAYIFALQKGADKAMVERLDEGLRHLDCVMTRELGKEVAQIPGAGAAGAMGAGVVAFLGGSLKPGIDAVLDIVDYNSLLEGTDLVFTGEGRIDSQSLRGKVVIGVARRAKAYGVPVVAVVGSIGEGAELAYDMGVNAIFSINRTAEAFETARYKSRENLYATAGDILRLWNIKS